jgi:sugar-specific transcriptional regulator TrmB
VFKTLLNLGFTEMDSKVYVFLAKRGMQKAFDMSKSMKMNKEQLYRSLKKLQSKGIVTATLEHPARFSAVPFEEVLDLFIKSKMEEAQEIQQNKDEILSVWKSLAVGQTDAAARFTVIEGRNIIYSRIQQMLQETKNRFSTISSVSGLLRANQHGLFDNSYKKFSDSGIQFKFITELSDQNLGAIRTLLTEMARAKLNFEGRTPDLGLRLFPRMVIRDQEEVMFFISPNGSTASNEEENTCLWTNSRSLAQAFNAVFEDLWKNASDLRDKIQSLESGEPLQKTQIFVDAETARSKYDETLAAAKREIMIMTSSEGLSDVSLHQSQLEQGHRKGVSVKVMAPITEENFEVAKRLSETCTVRQVAFSYLMTTIVDGKHLFQFEKEQTDKKAFGPRPRFENMLYTNDPEYVKKTELMLNGIWGNALPPTDETTRSILGFSTTANVSPEAVSRFVKKMKASSPEGLPRGHVTSAVAYIHPPNRLNMPTIAIRIFRYEKESSFGEGNTIDVRLQLKTPKGYDFVPVAAANTNRKAVVPEKAIFAGSPAAENYHLVRPEQLQVCRKGNTIFGGWTFPIPLPPTNQTLPPAALLIEGFGDQRHSRIVSRTPSGYRIVSEFDAFDAFVTFIDPSWKYAGPGSQGQVYFNSTMTIIPP